MKDIFPIGPNDKTVVVDEDNKVLFTDYPPLKAPPLAGKLLRKTAPLGKPHLLDIIGPKDENVLRVIGAAIDRPGQIIETDAIFRSERKRVRVLHTDLGGNQKRTHIVFEPQKE
jgi:hypothetical protein